MACCDDCAGQLATSLDLASNMFGHLGEDVRARLWAVVDNPTEATWDDAHGIILNRDVGLGLTLWQAVIAVDPTYPKSGRMDDDLITRFDRIPSQHTLLQAISYATR